MPDAGSVGYFMDTARLRAAYEQAKSDLLAERTADGHWIGELSSSALSTATAVSALAIVKAGAFKASGGRQPPEASPTVDLGPGTLDSLIDRGVNYLVAQQNSDGGFGDTDLSHSNIATTYLVVAALHLAGVADRHTELLARANAYIDSKGRLQGLRERYGIDKTFVVPIMTNMALAGLLDWREIDPLPFELACVPQSLYRFVGMPVVSYAIPALVAIGQARYFHAPPHNPLTRLTRWLSISRSLQVLRRMQPDSGGYLEATPLTSFVVMSLAAIHRSPHAPREGFISRSEMPTVIRHGVKFLANSIRPDGGWPIDTNLATWNTTLAINALAAVPENVPTLLGTHCFQWLHSCQQRKVHPFTGSAPYAFGWSDLSGAVPDADDTAGMSLAISAWMKCSGATKDEVMLGRVIREMAFHWLLRLQNADGGWPTFCRGWGSLPFDRSGTDLTAHVLRAFAAARAGLHYPEIWEAGDPIKEAVEKGRKHLRARANTNGSWSPLWFGNQDHPQEDNPVYGTAKVLFAYRDLGLMDSPEAQRGVAWLVANQNADGGWGSGVWERVKAKHGTRSGVESTEVVTGSGGTGHLVRGAECANVSGASPQGADAPRSPMDATRSPSTTHLTSSVEETALAVEALLAALNPEPRTLNPDRNAAEGVPYSPAAAAIEKGLTWLTLRVERGEHRQPAPIGFYFAKLWYYERLYPLTFTVAALGRACRQISGRPIDRPSTAHPASTGTTPWTTAAP